MVTTQARSSRESFAGKRQAEDCRDCEAARGGGEDVTGWQLHSDNYLHNHLRGAGRASANPAFERWRKELEAEVGQGMAFARRTATEAGGWAPGSGLPHERVGGGAEG